MEFHSPPYWFHDVCPGNVYPGVKTSLETAEFGNQWNDSPDLTTWSPMLMLLLVPGSLDRLPQTMLLAVPTSPSGSAGSVSGSREDDSNPAKTGSEGPLHGSLVLVVCCLQMHRCFRWENASTRVPLRPASDRSKWTAEDARRRAEAARGLGSRDAGPGSAGWNWVASSHVGQRGVSRSSSGLGFHLRCCLGLHSS